MYFIHKPNSKWNTLTCTFRFDKKDSHYLSKLVKLNNIFKYIRNYGIKVHV